MRSPASPDPFGTAELRRRVLDTWAASPSRFREDANAEEDLARGSYRDRVVVELAQNASDAAARAALPGRLLLSLDGRTLRAANTGAPLDAAGVEGLATLRASAKRDDTASAVGRFGVGFAAVLAVTDEPAVVSRSGAVGWSREAAVAEALAVPELAGELERRGRAVPVLRLPYPGSGEVPDPYDTVVVLPLRDDRAVALVRELLEGVDDALLLALPALAEVTVDVDGDRRVLAARRSDDSVVVTEGSRTTRWRLGRRSGRVEPELLADRPAEEPDVWSVAVAVPVDADGAPAPLPEPVARVVHAPTPTDERTDLPALVLATMPLDSSRRRVVPGPLTDRLATEVGTAYAELCAQLAAAGPGVLDLVPGPMPASELDGVLQRAVLGALAGTPLVPAASGESLLRPRDVVLVEGVRAAADPRSLAGVVPGLPDPGWLRAGPLRRLGAREVPLGDVVDRLGSLTIEPGQWRDLYAGLAGADTEALATLPVPLADGRLVRGPRGLFLETPSVGAGTLTALGLRVVAAGAVHPLLRRLGAVDATPAVVLRDPAVRAAVANPADDEEALRQTGAVLRLVTESGVSAEEEPWLAEVWLPDATGDLSAAGELWFPGSPLVEFLDVDTATYVVADEVLSRWGREALEAVGVRTGFALVRDADVPLDEDVWHDLDDESGWVDTVLAGVPDQELPPVLAELVAVRDLELVRADAWPVVVSMLAADQLARPALVQPAYLVLADGSRHAVPPYTAWWLRTHARFGGRPLVELCAADAEPLVRSILDPVPVELDDGAARALGLARTLDDLVAAPELLLQRLADPGLNVAGRDLAAVYTALGSAGVDPASCPPPNRIRVPAEGGSRVVDAGEVVVADGPQWLQLELPAVLPGSEELAQLLDLDLASDVHDPWPVGGGVTVDVPEVVSRLLPEAPATYAEHDDLVVAGRSVDWWVDPAGGLHAATLDGLARALAWVAGRWEARLLLTEALRDPEVVPALLAERAFE